MIKHSFSLLIKEEIASNEYESLSIKKAILSAFIRINGEMTIRNRRTILTLKNQNAKIVKFIYQLILDVFPSNTHIEFLKKNRGTLYLISIDNRVDEMLEFLEVSYLEGKISKNIAYDDETIGGYLAGAFLASGSCNSPKTSNYHLEYAFNNENYAKWFSHLFLRYKGAHLNPKTITRRSRYVAYLKKSDEIGDFLVILGAHKCAMDFASIRIDRDYHNQANRLENLDLANMSKTEHAGKRQAKEIKHLIDKYGMDGLGSPKVQLVAKIRMEYTSRSLDEIADMVSESLGVEVTKSNINHILRKLHEMYLKG